MSVVDLSDRTLDVHKVSSKTQHPLVEPPFPGLSGPSPPKAAWEALYPKGSINPSGSIPGGFGFYLSGSRDFSDALENDGAREVTMSYRLMLDKDFDFVKGGKCA